MLDLLERLRDALADRYAVESEIGRGGMATVYLAEDLKHRRQVAIKVLHPELAATLGGERFLREIEIAAGLNHPHILPLFDSGEAAGLLYYVMPYIEGESLQERLENEVQLPIEEAVNIAAEVAEGLDYAHRQGVIHRDIKPGNILLSEGHALIADFGIARAVGAAYEGEATALGLAVGTPKYMSPEQATADANVDGRSDLYALGCVLWEMLAGEPPFGGPTPQVILARKAVEEAPDVRAIRSRVPEALEVCLEGTLAPAPADRFATAGEFASALRDAVMLGVTPQAVARRKRKRRRRWVLALLAALVGASGLMAWRAHVDREQVRWARTEAEGEIRRLLSAGHADSAMQVALRMLEVLPGDTTADVPWDFFSRSLNVDTEPPGARVHYRPLAAEGDTTWRLLGTTPIEDALLPTVFARVRFQKDGHETREVLMPLWGGVDLRHLILDPKGSIPTGMVRINGFEILEGDWDNAPSDFSVGDYFLDRYEVTNRQYQEFVDDGGYEIAEYWTEPFVEDGRELLWDEAVKLFVDRTGRAGPGTWEDGTYAEGRSEYPVGGLSWYEAVAFARFAGKSLPSIWHLEKATNYQMISVMIPPSNFRGEGLAAVGSSSAEGEFGAYDQYGNVREWTFSARNDGRMIFGGGWNDADHAFGEWLARWLSPWDRSPENGMRLAQYPDTDGIVSANAPLVLGEWLGSRDYSLETPAGLEEFMGYARLYDYDAAPLDPIAELADTVFDWPMERTSFTGPDGTDRMGAYIFLPPQSRPPYQTVLFVSGYWPLFRSLEDQHVLMFDFLLRAGRAVAIPILTGTFGPYDQEVPVAEDVLYQTPSVRVQWAKEIRRVVDYLESRPDVDGGRIGYYGMFDGVTHAPIVLALEPRIRAGFLDSGALPTELPAPPPEVDPFHFLPRVRTPLLIINSRYSSTFPFERSQRPMLELLGTPPEHRRLDSGAYMDPVPFFDLVGRVNPWFDRYLGSVEGY